ncbi:MAG: GIY-YIG nuclease family protein [Pseudomonadota bacterium]|nr:GIY-YIG nuclease family protein [Pseudomonadota bacterium]
MDTRGYVYILANRPYGTVYIGVTTDLVRRVCDHYTEIFPDSFSARFGVKLLVWYEVHPSILTAMTREKQLKKWNRNWKIRLINSVNPYWRDLFDDIGGF